MEISKVTPITTIKLCRGVKTDPSYSDVLTHANRTSQFNYYSKKAKKTCNNAVPVRNNVMRVPYCYDDIYDCNYVIWQNANFTDKWFYGFIRSMNWVNINVTEIEIEMDVWETWQFDLTFKPCFIERMHVSSDSLGEWKAPEPFDVNNRLYRLSNLTNYGNSYKVATFFIPQDSEVDVITGAKGMPYFCTATTYDSSSAQAFFNTNLQPLIDAGLSDNIIGSVMVPSFITFVGKNTYTQTLRRSRFLNLDGYVPVNKKLLTFPYNSLRVASVNGLQGEYWLDLFEADDMIFQVTGALSLDLMLYGDFKNYQRTYETPESIPIQPYTNVVSGFPQCIMSGIQSQGYAQAASALAMQAVAGVKEYGSRMIENLRGSNAGRAIRDYMSHTAGGKVISGIKNEENKVYSAANKAIGVVGGAALNLGEAKMNDINREAAPDYAYISNLPSSTSGWVAFDGDFQFLHCSIDSTKAKRYDRYLTRWGYSIQDVLEPEINSRKVFNYVKTQDCKCIGNIYMADLLSIRKIFDDGVTLWHNQRGYEPGDWNGSAGGNEIV